MLEQSIQDYIDTLSQHLQRSVAVDDVKINLIAVSKHFTYLDDLRMQALIERKVDKNFTDYLYSFGILDTDEDSVTVAANESLNVLQRQCYPIRWDEEIIGFLWLLGETDSASDAAAISTAKVLAFPLFGLLQARHKLELAASDLVYDLLFENEQHASQAVLFYEKQQRLSSKHRYRVICINASLSSKKNIITELNFLQEHLKNVALLSNSGHKKFRPLSTQYNKELLAIIPANNVAENMLTLESFLKKIGMDYVRIGVGMRQNLFQLQESYQNALHIAQVLCVFTNLRCIAQQKDLGIYGKLAFILMDKKGMVDTKFLAPNVHLLWEQGQDLIATLEVYLDSAGNVAETAQTLNIHRSTLYYRLSRVEEITNTSLKSGMDRLVLHMEIKLWQLTLQNTHS